MSESLFAKRWKRVVDAIQLRIPDRVPTLIDFGYFPTRYTGITKEDAVYSCEKWMSATKKTVMDFKPDIFQCLPFISGEVYEIINTKLFKWPGHGVGPNQTHQYVESEYMKANEYDAFLQDPLEFIIRSHLPQTSESLSYLSMFPDITDIIGIGRGSVGTLFANPHFASACKTIYKASVVSNRWTESWIGFVREMEELGFPAITTGRIGQAPFDFISDHLRGMKGAMIDMYRQPDKLQEAMQKILPVMIRKAKSLANRGTNTLVFNGPHRGSEGFMSKKQFETFYWPGMKKVIEALVEVGVTPYMFWEGDYTSRLEYLLELPERKILNRFDRTDLFKAKEILGRHQCIAGGPLPGLLQTGTPQEVKDYCKKLIEIVGRDGGFILSHSCVLDEANPENVKAMIDSTLEYGVYGQNNLK